MTIRIGEQTDFRLQVSSAMNLDSITWPLVEDTLHRYIEVVDQSVDTLIDGALEKRYTITSWDTGYHVIRPLKLRVEGQDYFSAPALLEVLSMEVDTAAAPMDIKEIVEVKLSLSDYLRLYWPYLIGVLALIIIVWLILRANRKDGASTIEIAKKPKADVWAECRSALTTLIEEERWNQEDVKTYYTRITDILRVYLEDRYRIKAQEQTSREIIDALRYKGLAPSTMDKLQAILNTADMAKFAKERPGSHIAEGHSRDALAILDETRPSISESSSDAE